MDDLISRQAVKELAHNQVREKFCGMAFKKHRDFYIKLADSIIDLLPPIQPEPHWIPVTERLPESKEEDLEYPTVLICFENEEIMLGCFYESTKEWGTGEYFDKKCDPIAWMPLPEPFKGVTE